jgi:hypothetical protein
MTNPARKPAIKPTTIQATKPIPISIIILHIFPIWLIC